MALRNAAAATAPAPAPAFEPEGDAPTATINTSTTPANDSAAAPVGTAVTVPQKTAVASPLLSGSVLKDLKDVIGTTELEAVGVGTFPRITVGLDGFSMDKTKELGRKIKFRVLSWNFVWMVTTGESTDNAEANKLIRTSYDGVNIKGGEGKVEDYLKKLRDVEGYGKASTRQYGEIFANLLWSEAKGDVPEDEQGIVQISLSPQSLMKWQGYILESAVRKARFGIDSDEVVATQEKKILGPNKFGVAVFSPK